MPERLRRRERLALNLFDVDALDPDLRKAALAGRLDLTGAGHLDESDPDGRGLVLKCPLLEAATVCDLLRGRAGPGGLRTYLERPGLGWSRVPEGRPLTVVFGGRARLNPAVFPGAVAVLARPAAADVSGLGEELDCD